MMADDSWSNFQTKFAALGHGGWLHANWSSIPDDDRNQWHLAGKDEVAREDFRQLAEQAAFKLGHRKASTAVSFWLDTLKQDRPGCFEIVSIGVVADRNGKSYIPLENGIIEGLCRISEKYCWMLVMKDVEVAGAPAAPRPAVGQPTQPERERPYLNVELIKSWMYEEGWTSKVLAKKLGKSERTISSIFNNGGSHGRPVITKLAKLMNRDAADLYLTSPEAST